MANGNGNSNGNGGHTVSQNVFQWVISTLVGIILAGGGVFITYFLSSQTARDDALLRQNAKFESQLDTISEASIKTAAAVEHLAKETTRSDAAITALSTAFQSLSDRMTRIEAHNGPAN